MNGTPTPEQSAANFSAHSMLCDKDVVQTLDRWADQLKANDLRIDLCEPSRKILARTVASMRMYVMANGIPHICHEITGTEYRYVLDWYADGLQLGIERYDESTLFDEDGDTVFQPVDEESVSDNKDDAADEHPWYILVHKVPVPHWPIDKWAEQNNVRTATARQWVNRNRIAARKENGSLRVSSIMYTPDALRASKNVTYRFHNIKDVPTELVAICPLLSGTVLDFMITHDDNAPGAYRCLSIHFNADGVLKTETGNLTAAERSKIIEALSSAQNTKATCEKYYNSPFDHNPDNIVQHHAHLAPLANGEQKIIRKLIGTGRMECVETDTSNSDKDETPTAPAVSVNASFTDPDSQAFASIRGTFRIHELTPETRLLHCIFGTPKEESELDAALEHTGLPTQKREHYEWNHRVLVIDQITVTDGFQSTNTVLKRLHVLLKRTLCLEPTLILIDKSAVPAASDPHVCGYRNAGKYLYAYVPHGNVFTGFKTKTNTNDKG